jgi:site-specific DNA recombinase
MAKVFQMNKTGCRVRSTPGQPSPQRKPVEKVRIMAVRNLNLHCLIPAVAYYRMSSDKQVATIPEQREAVLRYAREHGYHIVREYIDEGISGDDTKHRLQFQAMHKAACNDRDFDVILVWDSDRFGRFDSLESGYWVHPLRQAGVKLVTVNEGLVDWSDFTGRVMHSIKAEGKHQFLHDLSRNTLRGKLDAAKQGYWLSRAPFGYRLESDASSTDKRKRCRLVLGDQQDVATVQRIFALYLQGLSIRSIAHLLTGKGAGHSVWSTTTIQKILTSQTYVGTYCWNMRRHGKYGSIAGGEVAKRG